MQNLDPTESQRTRAQDRPFHISVHLTFNLRLSTPAWNSSWSRAKAQHGILCRKKKHAVTSVKCSTAFHFTFSHKRYRMTSTLKSSQAPFYWRIPGGPPPQVQAIESCRFRGEVRKGTLTSISVCSLCFLFLSIDRRAYRWIFSPFPSKKFIFPTFHVLLPDSALSHCATIPWR